MTTAENALLVPGATGRSPVGPGVDGGGVLGHNELSGKQGGSVVDRSFYHLSTAEWGVLRGNQPFTAGGLLYADGDGKLKTDATNLYWNATDKQLLLGVGSALKPPYAFIGFPDDGMLHPADNTLGWAVDGVERMRLTTELWVHSGAYDTRASHFVGYSVWGFTASSRGSAVISSPNSVTAPSLRRVMLGNNLRYDTTVVAGTHVGYAKESAAIAAAGIAIAAPNISGGTMEFLLANDTNDDTWVVTTAMTLNMTELTMYGRLRVEGGTALWPTISRIGFTDDGLYWPGDGLLSVTLGGTERWRWSGDNVGVRATGRICLDGVACTGDTYIYEHALGNIIAFSAGGNLEFEVMTDRVWIDPTNPAGFADGQVWMAATRRALGSYVGGEEGYGDRLTHSQVVDTTCNLDPETVVSTYTIPATSWAVGKVYKFAASGYCNCGGNTITIGVRIGGLGGALLFQDAINNPAQAIWRMSGELVCRTVAVGGTIGYGIEWARSANATDAHAGNQALNTVAAQALVITHDGSVAGPTTTIYTFEVWEA